MLAVGGVLKGKDSEHYETQKGLYFNYTTYVSPIVIYVFTCVVRTKEKKVRYCRTGRFRAHEVFADYRKLQLAVMLCSRIGT